MRPDLALRQAAQATIQLHRRRFGRAGGISVRLKSAGIDFEPPRNRGVAIAFPERGRPAERLMQALAAKAGKSRSGRSAEFCDLPVWRNPGNETSCFKK